MGGILFLTEALERWPNKSQHKTHVLPASTWPFLGDESPADVEHVQFFTVSEACFSQGFKGASKGQSRKIRKTSYVSSTVQNMELSFKVWNPMPSHLEIWWNLSLISIILAGRKLRAKRPRDRQRPAVIWRDRCFDSRIDGMIGQTIHTNQQFCGNQTWQWKMTHL